MERRDLELEWRVRDVIAVVTDDIDAVRYEVEDGIAYIEGVVPSDRERRQIIDAAKRIDGLEQVVTCLSTEHVMPCLRHYTASDVSSAPSMTFYHSLS